MLLHANAKLGLAGRVALVGAVEDGLSLRAAAVTSTLIGLAVSFRPTAICPVRGCADPGCAVRRGGASGRESAAA
jgi:hypothetical protein